MVKAIRPGLARQAAAKPDARLWVGQNHTNVGVISHSLSWRIVILRRRRVILYGRTVVLCRGSVVIRVTRVRIRIVPGVRSPEDAGVVAAVEYSAAVETVMVDAADMPAMDVPAADVAASAASGAHVPTAGVAATAASGASVPTTAASATTAFLSER